MCELDPRRMTPVNLNERRRLSAVELLQSLGFEIPEERGPGQDMAVVTSLYQVEDRALRAAICEGMSQQQLNLALRFAEDLAEVVEFLDLGADPKTESLLHLFVIASCPQALEMIAHVCGQGADTDAVDSSGNAPLHLAVYDSVFPRAAVLIERGANVNIQDSAGCTPLHLVADRSWPWEERELDFVNLLTRYGADPWLRCKHGCSAIDLARDWDSRHPEGPSREALVLRSSASATDQ